MNSFGFGGGPISQNEKHILPLWNPDSKWHWCTQNSNYIANLGGGGLLRWIKNELIWIFLGGGEGVFLHWIKNELIWILGGLIFFSTHAFHIHTHAIQIRLVMLCVSRSTTKKCFCLHPESKYERILYFKPCVYLAYFRVMAIWKL